MLATASKCATWPSACTPASVRPAPRIVVGVPTISDSASSIACCTARPLACRCQPAKSVPSYSTVMRKRGIEAGASLLEFEGEAGVERLVGQVHLVGGAEAGDVGVVELAEQIGVVDAELRVDDLGRRRVEHVEEERAA